jgi:hypothetical protein
MAHSQRWHEHRVQLRIGSMTILLLLLVLNVFVVPFIVAPDSISAQVARDVLLSLILLSGVATVWGHRLQFVTIALVAAVAIALDRMAHPARNNAWTTRRNSALFARHSLCCHRDQGVQRRHRDV